MKSSKVERVAARFDLAVARLRAEETVVVRGAGERGENLLSVDDPSAVDSLRRRSERDFPCRGAARLGKGLGIHSAISDHAPVVDGAAALVTGPLLLRHVQLIREWAGPQRGRGVHIERQCGRPAPAPKLRGDPRISGVTCAKAAVLLWHRDTKKPRLAHVVVVGKWERSLAVPFVGPRGKLLAS